MQYLRSLIYVFQIYLAMLVIGAVWLPWAIISERGALHACKSWCRWTLWTAKWMVGLDHEVRGTLPEGEYVVAAKHQSFMDVAIIFLNVPRGRFIMKHSLIYAPILGVYGLRIGCIPVKRGQRAQAISKMKADVAAGRREGGQMLIYPQGTRVEPGVSAPYKVGAAILSEQLNQPCVPVACNVGLFWPRYGILRKPGKAVVEFLPAIPPGQSVPDLTAMLAEQIEERSNALMAEAGFKGITHEQG